MIGRMVGAIVAALVAGLIVIPLWLLIAATGIPLWITAVVSVGIALWPAWASGKVIERLANRALAATPRDK